MSLIAEAAIAADTHHFYELPLPDDFLRPGRRERWIKIGLSHMPPTRTTRIEYRASRMQFRLVKAASLDEVSRIYQHTKKEERERQLEELRQGGNPGTDHRSKGSGQAARYAVKMLTANDSQMRLFVVVTHTVNEWGRHLIESEEDYALVVALEERSESDVRYLTQIRAKLQARAKLRVRR